MSAFLVRNILDNSQEPISPGSWLAEHFHEAWSSVPHAHTCLAEISCFVSFSVIFLLSNKHRPCTE